MFEPEGTATSSRANPSGATLTVQVGGQGGVPTSGVSAVVLNVTTLNVGGNGYGNVYPHGAGVPDGRSLTLTTGTTMSNVAITGVSTDGKVDVLASQATDVLIDVSGWYDTPDAGTGSGFYPLDGQRILDTRNGTGVCSPSSCAAIPSGGTLTLQVGGQGNVPASGVSAVALTVTELNSTTSGFVQVWPAAWTQPVGRNLSYNGTGVSELVVTQLSADGKVSIYTSSSSINALVDVAGYYTASQDGTGSVFVPAGSDQRILDTRNGTGTCTPSPCTALPSSTNVTVSVAGNGGVPTDASAVVLNATVFNPSADGALVIWNADDATQPPGRNLSYSAGKSASNTAMVGLGPTGAVDVRAINNSTDLTLDVEGWYVAQGGLTAETVSSTMTTQYATRILGAAPSGASGIADSPGEDSSGDTSDAPGPADTADLEQVELTDGSVITLPASEAQTALTAGQNYAAAAEGSGSTITPDNTVYGDCGSSYVSLYERSTGNPVRMATGFHVNRAATSYQWLGSIIGRGAADSYAYGYSSSGDLFFRTSWNGGHVSHMDYPHGIYVATINPELSYAFLIDGSFCVSGGPVARRNL